MHHLNQQRVPCCLTTRRFVQSTCRSDLSKLVEILMDVPRLYCSLLIICEGCCELCVGAFHGANNFDMHVCFGGASARNTFGAPQQIEFLWLAQSSAKITSLLLHTSDSKESVLHSVWWYDITNAVCQETLIYDEPSILCAQSVHSVGNHKSLQITWHCSNWRLQAVCPNLEFRWNFCSFHSRIVTIQPLRLSNST